MKYATGREMGWADDENGLKRLIRRRLGPRCVIFLIHGFFSYSLMFYFMYIGSTLRNTQPRGRWDVQTTRTGPNDASSVVWPLWERRMKSMYTM